MEKVSIEGKVDNLTKDVNELKLDNALIKSDLNNLKVNMPIMIESSVNKASEINNLKIQKELKEGIKDAFENADHKRLKQKEEENKDMYRHIKKQWLTLILGCVFTFVCGVVANNLMINKGTENKDNQIEELREELSEQETLVRKQQITLHDYENQLCVLTNNC